MAETSRSYAQSVLDKFRSQANQFEQKFKQHLQYESAARRDPRLYANWVTVRDRGLFVKKTVEGLRDKVESVVKWLRETFGINLQGLGEMGVLPIVPILAIGAIVAGIALITKWLSDAYVFEQKIKSTQALISQGVEPSRAAEIVSQAAKTESLFEGILSTKTLGLLVIGGITIFLLPKLLQGRANR